MTVILYHASAWGFIAMFFWTDRYLLVTAPNFDQMGSVSYFALRVIEQLIIYGIPTFLFVSGFFITISTGRSQKTISRKIVLERIKNLAIPFLLWSFVILTLKMIQGAQFSAPEMVLTILLGRTTDAYYFVPVLIQFYLLSIFLVPLARQTPALLLALSATLQVGVHIFRYASIASLPLPSFIQSIEFIGLSWFFPGYIFWFSFGLVVGFHLSKMSAFLSTFRYVFLASIGVFFILGMIEWEMLLNRSSQTWIGPQETLIDNLYAAAFLLTYLAFNKVRLPFSQQISTLGAKSFGIYLVHSPVLEYSARILYHIAPGILGYPILFMPVLIFLGFFVPLTLMGIVNRLPVRRYYQYAFG